MNPGDSFRIYYQPGETGWATLLSGNRARLSNIPIDGPFNVDDVVTIHRGEFEGDLPRAGEALERRYRYRSCLGYEPQGDGRARYRSLRGMVLARGWKCEGLSARRCLVAHDIPGARVLEALRLARFDGAEIETEDLGGITP